MVIKAGMAAVKKIPSWVWIASAAGVALYIIKKGSISAAVQGVTAGAVGAAGSAATGAASGVVLGIGDVLGIPRTDETACERAQRLGNRFDASKYCTAGQYLKWQYEDLFN